MKTLEYFKKIRNQYDLGISTEHSYRADLQYYIQSLVNGINVTNEPKRQECGAPDYIILNNNIPVGYIEAKDIGSDLEKIENSPQLMRYRESLHNLILTDYINFRLFRNGEKLLTIKIGEIKKGRIIQDAEGFKQLENLIKEFCTFKGQTINSPEKLAKIMASKAKMMQEVLYNALVNNSDDGTLQAQFKAFKNILIHDLDEYKFSDIYAQTITYGLFAARLNDTTLNNFTRQEALFLVPKSNPFLRQLFTYVAGPELDERVVWIVDDLAEIFSSTNLVDLLKNFRKVTQQHDPFIHFYETFLSEYSPKLRKSRGVYYTPEPVVNFIIRAVDKILKDEFDLLLGLADTSKIEIKVDQQGKKVKRLVHRVQILDPAVGTGTFLSEVIKHIFKNFENKRGIWPSYVKSELIPRINGFEVLMAPYTMCHIKLEMLLKETGYKPIDEINQPRLRIFLTNSLEEAHPDTGTLFANWLSDEANEANILKRDTPIMVILGNPPYSNFGQMNKGEWINSLLEDYKNGIKDRKINLDDDYIKFIRFSQYYIDKNGGGIVALITNNSYLDGISHRQMRKHLVKTFDKIYIYNLHGDMKKKEKASDNGKDQNVFDIKQGVAISIFVKMKSRKAKKILYYDSFGLRKDKYDRLWEQEIDSIPWQLIKPDEINCYFVPKNFENNEYNDYVSLTDIFLKYSSGIQTKCDNISVQYNQKTLEQIIEDFKKLTLDELRLKYNKTETSGWNFNDAKNDLILNKGIFSKIQYRPFDFRWIYFTGKSSGFMGRPRTEIMKHIIDKSNIGLIFNRKIANKEFSHALVSKCPICHGTFYLGNVGQDYFAPLYLYLDSNEGQVTIEGIGNRIPNLNMEFVNNLANKVGLKFTKEKTESHKEFSPIDVLDYIYCVLYSPKYRNDNRQHLRDDFPKVPYPSDVDSFHHMVNIGESLRKLHLLESDKLEKVDILYPIDGSNNIEYVSYNDEKVWINDKQYFDNVPALAWNYYIGGYQPASKWLKDRIGLSLGFEDINHYIKIISAILETNKITDQIH